ncbi:hypothetical protein M513_10168 [Trichuris suis]|uniref:Histone-lysine N-methyltransferase, H3 lysine-79 specific n=1 Tax=Trichuris suis TaxID=68888 RepID=A0A085LVD1_9BILA|nr:hypothetical protein M513_10168 [Trichuris suis]
MEKIYVPVGHSPLLVTDSVTNSSQFLRDQLPNSEVTKKNRPVLDVTPQKENVLEKRFLNLVSPITGSRVRISFPFVMTKSYNAAGELLSSIRFVVELIPAFLENLQELNGLLENSAGYDALLRWSKQFNYDAEMFLKRDRNGVDYQSFQNTKELLVEHILQVVYNNSVVKPAKLNLYPPSTSSAYGETSFQMVEEMIRYLNITSNDSFLDLGSGVGQVVLHVAAATQCRVSVGIECREWPIFFARVMPIVHWPRFLFFRSGDEFHFPALDELVWSSISELRIIGR